MLASGNARAAESTEPLIQIAAKSKFAAKYANSNLCAAIVVAVYLVATVSTWMFVATCKAEA
jgi:hypothetical protein